MKKIITRSLVIIFSIGMLITGLLNIFLQMHLDKKEFQRITEEHFWQIEHILEENKEDISSVEKEFAQNCIAHARAAAYISRHFPEMIESREECIKVAELLQIDELHFFTPEGVIYAGTHPEYYGYSFSSGEQMAFFALMLGDYSMELCQDIEPNTAENKLMQYSAVWSRITRESCR